MSETGFPNGEERLQESAADVASIVGAVAGVGGLGLSVAQAYYARASYELQRKSTEEYNPGFAGQGDYDPGFVERDEYDPGFLGQNDYDPGFAGQDEYDPGFEDLGY
jgi:hypothetical protein